jgi:hypothetical protein
MTDKRPPPPKNPNPPKPEPDEGDDRRPRHRPDGREHQVHRDILERRWRGGPEPTPEEYQRALEEWKKLPGSIVRPPSDIKLPEPPAPAPQTPAPQPGSPRRDEQGGGS